MAAGSLSSPKSFEATGEGFFYVSVGVFALVFCAAAFGPGMVSGEGRLGSMTPLLALHGVALFAWLLLFIAQALLVRTGHVAVHRRVGTWSTILAAAIVVFG